METIVYTKENCVQCDMTKRLMDKMDIEYTPIQASDTEIDQLREEGFRSFPVVKSEADEWGGFRPDLIKNLAVLAMGEVNGTITTTS